MTKSHTLRMLACRKYRAWILETSGLIKLSLVQIMARRLVGAKPLSEPLLGHSQLDPRENNQWNISRYLNIFISRKGVCKCRLENYGYFVWTSGFIPIDSELFPAVQLAKVRHWFMYWLGTERTPSHSLYNWRPGTTYANMPAIQTECCFRF